ncbi:LacI family DNA-binding transcriptional regulator [Kineococcus gypseus]|uniref:LacI family DNA-binding transcriptional regulator n=1 Tax=Kineococcus gypseus TaxID=1637102 RepID=UPI003D7ED1AE
MRDVATEAGVSPMTVSNTLTGRRPVSEETRRRVLETVDRLGYRVNVAARSLRQGRTGVVGIAVPGLDSHYFGQLSHRLVLALAGAGLATVVEETGASRSGELAVFRDSRRNAYDGLVIAALRLSERDLRALSGDVPVVVLGEQDLHGSVDQISMANVEGAAAAARLLLARGCRRLAVVGGVLPGAPGAEEVPESFAVRTGGFLRAVRRSRGAVTAATYRGDLQDAGVRGVHDLLAAGEPPEGIFCVTDTLALGVLRGLADHGLRVPEDVLVIGFDDVDDARFSVPSLTTVDPGHEEIARETVRLLVRRTADRDAAPERLTAPWRLVERESTARPGTAPRRPRRRP